MVLSGGRRTLSPLGVGRVGSYEKVDVLGKAGLHMQDDGVTSDNEIFNAMGMEGGQKVFVVSVHQARSPTP